VVEGSRKYGLRPCRASARQLDEARVDLKGELHKDVSRDFFVAAHQTIIKGLQDELQTCSTAGKREYIVLTYPRLR